MEICFYGRKASKLFLRQPIFNKIMFIVFLYLFRERGRYMVHIDNIDESFGGREFSKNRNKWFWNDWKPKKNPHLVAKEVGKLLSSFLQSASGNREQLMIVYKRMKMHQTLRFSAPFKVSANGAWTLSCSSSDCNISFIMLSKLWNIRYLG